MARQVLKIEIESSNTSAMCFHPFKQLLTTVDGRGVVRVINYSLLPTDSKLILDARAVVNRFHLARGAPICWCRAVRCSAALRLCKRLDKTLQVLQKTMRRAAAL